MLNQNSFETKKTRKPMSAETKAKMAAILIKAREAAKTKRQLENPKSNNVVSIPTHNTNETDAQILEKLTNRFNSMDKMVNASFQGYTRSLIISGPAGLGKSYGVTKIVEQMEDQGRKVASVSGMVRATGLYKTFYENRLPGNVVVFDDADVVWFDDICLNLMKKACDMTKRRTLSWLAETNMATEDGERLPTSFDFEGTVIFITNLDFDNMISKNHRLAPHFEAMISRSMYLDLGMKTKRDYLVRMKMVLPAMLDNTGIGHEDGIAILAYIEANLERLRELSLRMVAKIITLMQMDPVNWQTEANVFCLKSN